MYYNLVHFITSEKIGQIVIKINLDINILLTLRKLLLFSLKNKINTRKQLNILIRNGSGIV